MERESFTKEITDKFTIVTDTHFGRVFKEGVPLNRRGEYENIIYEDFKKFLNTDTSKIVIHAGDLFESPYVNNEVLMKVFELLEKNTCPLTHYYFIAGNHDLPKDKTMVQCSSFYILSKLLEHHLNIHFVFETKKVEDDILLVPYYYDNLNFDNVKTVIGHFDNPLPIEIINFVGDKYSGHYHKREITNDGTLFIGSFYPIAFGEERDSSVMETITLEEYNSRSDDELKNKRIRIILKDGEELPIDHPCLQLIGKKSKNKEIDLEITSDENFDFKQLFMEYLKDIKIAERLWDRYLELKGTEL